MLQHLTDGMARIGPPSALRVGQGDGGLSPFISTQSDTKPDQAALPLEIDCEKEEGQADPVPLTLTKV